MKDLKINAICPITKDQRRDPTKKQRVDPEKKKKGPKERGSPQNKHYYGGSTGLELSLFICFTKIAL